MDTLVKNASETKNRELAGTKERTTRKNMNTTLFILLVSSFGVLLDGCRGQASSIGTHNESAVVRRSIDLSNAKETELGQMNQFFDSWSLVQLETNKDCLIGEIRKIIVQPDRLYIMDSDVAEAVFIFDREGNWINTIARKGRGPGEYINFTDIEYDTHTQQLYMLCGNKIMIFDRDGEYVSSVNTRFVPNEIAIADDYFVISTTVSQGQFTSSVIICDRNMQVISQFFPRPREWNSISSRSGSPFSTYKNNIYYFPGENTYVYNIAKDSVDAKLMYDFGRFNLPENLKGPGRTPDKLRAIQAYVSHMTLFQETDKYFISAVLLNGRYYLVFNSKDNEQEYNTYIPFNHPFILLGFGSLIGITEDYVIAKSDADVVYRILNEQDALRAERDPEGWEYYKSQLTRDLEEEDNPILYFYKLK